jgi:hypothetical protein
MTASVPKLSDFIGKIDNWDYDAIISLAEQEAMSAERRFYKRGQQRDEIGRHCQDYAAVMKRLIDYLRYDARPRHLDPVEAQIVSEIQAKANTKRNRLESSRDAHRHANPCSLTEASGNA